MEVLGGDDFSKDRPVSGWRSALALLALVVVAAGLSQTGQGHSLLRDVGLYKDPASYAELAFADPSKLPGQLPSKRAPIRVAFRVHNVSGASRGYRWSIALVHSGKSSQATSGVVQLPAQGDVMVAKTATATCTGGRLQVVVRLADPAESIDFWVTCPPTKPTKRSAR